MSNEKLDKNQILAHQKKCLEKIQNEQLYEIRNDAKLRAVYSSTNYDEFKDIVDAAHLKSLTKSDKNDPTTKNRLWNSSVKETD